MSSDREPRPSKPVASSAAVRRNMQAVGFESAIEQRLRSELHRAGLRYRKHAKAVPGLRCRPDILFPRQRLAVFVDGCFWHCCPEHATYPERNGDWWAHKLKENVRRDRRNDSELTAAGWCVVRLWEHETVEAMVERVISALRVLTA